MHVIKLLRNFSKKFLKDAAYWHLYPVVFVLGSNTKEVVA